MNIYTFSDVRKRLVEHSLWEAFATGIPSPEQTIIEAINDELDEVLSRKDRVKRRGILEEALLPLRLSDNPSKVNFYTLLLLSVIFMITGVAIAFVHYSEGMGILLIAAIGVTVTVLECLRVRYGAKLLEQKRNRITFLQDELQAILDLEYKCDSIQSAFIQYKARIENDDELMQICANSNYNSQFSLSVTMPSIYEITIRMADGCTFQSLRRRFNESTGSCRRIILELQEELNHTEENMIPFFRVR